VAGLKTFMEEWNANGHDTFAYTLNFNELLESFFFVSVMN